MDKDIFYIHYNRFRYLATFKKELTLVLPAQETKAVPPLSQIFTQVGLNTNEFCEKFNNMTKNFLAGTLIPISVFYTPKEKNFEICFRPFQLKLILQQYMDLVILPETNQSIYKITAINLYRALIIKSYVLNENNLRKLLRSILGTLRSYEFAVQIVFTIEDIQEILKYNILKKEQFVDIIDYIEKEKSEELNSDENIINLIEKSEIDEDNSDSEENLSTEIQFFENYNIISEEEDVSK